MSNEELNYTFFDEDGPCVLTETELVNDYMELRAAARRYAACSMERMRQEKDFGGCPHTRLMGGDQELACFALLMNALGKRWQGEPFPVQGDPA